MVQSAPPGKSPAARGVVAVLLIAAIIGTLWVPFYARSMPKLGDFPFFTGIRLFWCLR